MPLFARISILFSLLGAMSLLANEGIDFEKQILPIFQDRCLECHQAPREKNGRIYNPKAGLRMDGLAHLMFGSDEGPVLVPNHPSKSPLYNRVSLPSEDDDRMPPKGDPLSFAQQDLIRQWIGQGADFGNWVGATDGLEKLVRKDAHQNQKIPEFVLFYQELGNGVPAVDEKKIEKARSASGLLIRPIGIKSPLLEVRVVTRHQHVGDEQIRALIPISRQVVKLDLRNTSISNEACKTIARFENLIELNIRACSVDDQGVQEFTTLPKIKKINAGQTQLGGEGLARLSQIASLEELNIWGCIAVKKIAGGFRPVRSGLQVID